jgi:hypothetical protein
MWGFQRQFRSSVEWALRKSLELLGVTVEPTVFLVGLSTEGGWGHRVSVEPDYGSIVPADFDGLHDRATDLYQQDPHINLVISVAWLHEKRHQEMRDRACAAAISEVLQAKLGLRFFAGLPTPVDRHRVFAAVGLREWVLDNTPHLTSEMALTDTWSRIL